VRLELPEDDAQSGTSNDDLAAPRVDDAHRSDRLRELPFVARARSLRERPSHVLQRDAQHVRRPGNLKRRRGFGVVTGAAGERERYCSQRKSTMTLIVKMIAITTVTRVRFRSTM
jgi:hypothetical protein